VIVQAIREGKKTRKKLPVITFNFSKSIPNKNSGFRPYFTEVLVSMRKITLLKRKHPPSP